MRPCSDAKILALLQRLHAHCLALSKEAVSQGLFIVLFLFQYGARHSHTLCDHMREASVILLKNDRMKELQVKKGQAAMPRSGYSEKEGGTKRGAISQISSLPLPPSVSLSRPGPESSRK
mmetsp:Transcript_1740/g.3607  ORF Transcript_1740/g.3607 Transcript_1740/m.3607 type:complete len:120 (-) Transcript_1740:1700-2059(-)